MIAHISWGCGDRLKFILSAISILTPEHVLFFFSSRRRHTRFDCDWSLCSSDLLEQAQSTPMRTIRTGAWFLRGFASLVSAPAARHVVRTNLKVRGRALHEQERGFPNSRNLH